MAWLMAWPTMALLNDGRVNNGSANCMMAQLHTKSPAKMMIVTGRTMAHLNDDRANDGSANGRWLG
jgi:hypothetical protein